MRHYEIVVLLRSGDSERNGGVIDRLKAVVADGGGALHRLEDWGDRVLAYPIQKQNRAHYFLLNIECGARVLEVLREEINFSRVIMRHMMVKRKIAVTDPSPIAKELQEALQKRQRSESSSGGVNHDQEEKK